MDNKDLAMALTGVGGALIGVAIDKVHQNIPFNSENSGNYLTKCPGPGLEWKENASPQTGRGSWVNGEHKLHPNLDHPDPRGPHWDYMGPKSSKWCENIP